jgi:hypothetical protein
MVSASAVTALRRPILFEQAKDKISSARMEHVPPIGSTGSDDHGQDDRSSQGSKNDREHIGIVM